MTKIAHHMTDELLMGYASGTLPEAFALAVATHISLCDECRAAVESYEALGGGVLEELESADLSDASLEATLNLIASMDSGPVDIEIACDPVLPAPLLAYVGKSLDDVKWMPVGMGVKQAILTTSSEASARLLYIPAGVAVPDHGHQGTEITMVLRGAYSDQQARFARGDVEIADEHLEHTPVADISEDCICLAVTDAPLKFNALLPRIAQTFLRI